MLVGLLTAALSAVAVLVPLFVGAQHTIAALHTQVHAQQSTILRQQSQLATQRPAVPAAPEGGHYLANVNPFADHLNAQPGPAVISGVSYPDSVTMSCYNYPGPGELYRVSGSRITAVVGISDGQAATSAGNGGHVTETVTFADQNGRLLGDRVNVSGGHPLRVDLSLAGVNELAISCQGRDSMTGSTNVAAPYLSLGDAATS
jgi:hypothetical protein